MPIMDEEQFLARFRQLQDEHRRALAIGDIPALERVQAELAELMKEDPRPAYGAVERLSDEQV